MSDEKAEGRRAAIADALNTAYRLGVYSARLAVDDAAGRRQIAEGRNYVEARLLELLEIDVAGQVSGSPSEP